jgi:hypothetical protein
MAAVRLPVLTPRLPADGNNNSTINAISINNPSSGKLIQSPTGGGINNSGASLSTGSPLSPRPPVAASGDGNGNGPPPPRPTHLSRGSSISIAPMGAAGGGRSPRMVIGGGTHVIHPAPRPPGHASNPSNGGNLTDRSTGGSGSGSVMMPPLIPPLIPPLPVGGVISAQHQHHQSDGGNNPIILSPSQPKGPPALSFSTASSDSSNGVGGGGNSGSRTERSHRRPSSGSTGGPTSPSMINGSNGNNNGAFTDRQPHPLERGVSVAHWNGPNSPPGITRTVSDRFDNGDGLDSVYDGLATRTGPMTSHLEKSPENKLRAINEAKAENNGASAMIASAGMGTDDVSTTDDWIALHVFVSNHEKVGKHGHYDPSLSVWAHHHMWKKLSAAHMQRDPDLASEVTTTMVCSTCPFSRLFDSFVSLTFVEFCCVVDAIRCIMQE